MFIALSIIVSALFFILIIVSLALQPKLIKRLMGLIILLVGFLGIIIYGYGYCSIYGVSPIAVTRTVFSVFGMFLGGNDISDVSKVDLISKKWVQSVFYVIHFLAIYATASSVVAGIGKRLIRALNLIVVRHKDLNVIYGVNDDSLKFAERLLTNGNKALVFVDRKLSTDHSDKILNMGGAILDEEYANDGAIKLVKKMGLRSGRQHVSFYCLNDNYSDNVVFAKKMLTALEQRHIKPEQTSAVMLTRDEKIDEIFQVSPDENGESKRYGYGSVYAVYPEALMARLLTKKYPICNTMEFDATGRAQGNFVSLVIGFGDSGQQVLKSLVMNGQFVNSRFCAYIVDLQLSKVSGSFFAVNPGIRENYSLIEAEINAKSAEFYDLISKIAGELKYVVICTGSEENNNEIREELSEMLDSSDCKATIVCCTKKKIYSKDKEGLIQTYDFFTPEILSLQQQDRLAKLLNHRYNIKKGNTVDRDWYLTDNFSRQSCRASVDFMDSFLAMAGISADELREKGWPETPELTENLSICEHLRWCAFHFAHGYRKMPQEMFEDRGRTFVEEKERGNLSYRIGKDVKNRYHACLCDWDELDELAEREKAYTNEAKDYKRLDLENVLMMQELLKTDHEKTKR